MKRRLIVLLLAAAFVTSTAARVCGAVIESGDLNIIVDAGNPSNGLQFLDLSITRNKTQAQALSAAQALYANARLAAPSEFDDLFSAAGIVYDGALSASDGFGVGASSTISTGTNYDSGQLAQALGITGTTAAIIWTAPDGNGSASTTRDYVYMQPGSVSILQALETPAHVHVAWLMVSEVPEPSSIVSWIGLSVCGLFFTWRRRKRAV